MHQFGGLWQKSKPLRQTFVFPIKKNIINYLEIQLEVFKKYEKGEYRKHQRINLGKSDLEQIYSSEIKLLLLL